VTIDIDGHTITAEPRLTGDHYSAGHLFAGDTGCVSLVSGASKSGQSASNAGWRYC